MFICPATGEACTTLGLGLMPFWAPDDAKVVFTVQPAFLGSWELHSVNRDGTAKEVLAQLPSFNPESLLLDISRQGQVPWVQFRPGRRELWLAELKR